MRFHHVSCAFLAIGLLVDCSGAAPQGGERVGSSTQALCATATLSSSVAGNFGAPGSPVQWTATAGCGGTETALYQFWVETPEGVWSVGQDWSATNTWTWTPSETGVYNFQVWVKANDSSAEYDTFSSQVYTSATVTSCTAVTASVSPSGSTPNGSLGQTSIGDAVTITSGASCGASTPEFQIWSEDPTGAWTMLQDYSTSTSYTWNTAGGLNGTYYFQVWARAVGSPATYDAFGSFAYILSTPCSAASSGFTPAMSTVAGNPVTYTAAATCGGTPTYEFWQQTPSGNWSVVQPWSTNATYSWDTTGATSGTYNYQVWVANQGSTAEYEVFTSASYVITGGAACTAGALNASVASPEPVGTSVTLTGSASSCVSANYQFWALPPGGSWTMVQDWSSTATYAPDTTSAGPGTYEYQVWIRQAGLTSGLETWSGLEYVLTAGGVDAGGGDAGVSDAGAGG